MKRFLPLIIILGLIFIPMMFVHSCANTTAAPTGGKKDTIPPYIIGINPLPGTTNVPTEGAKFVFTFNEYVTIKTASNVFLSPPQQKLPKVRMRGHDVTVSFEEPLEPNTTYTISFTDAIADANEGNMFAGYTYVFSTGEHIDSMMVTGTVRDCNTLTPMKGATVLLYKDLSDSAVFKHRPYAATKTDDWGFFCIPYIKDTLYHIYAIKDENSSNYYDPDNERIAFIDSLIRPVMHAGDTVREMLRYDMLDTLSCLARKSEHELNVFRERPSKQYIVNKVRTSERSAYITFMAPDAWIDSLWVGGYRADQVITQFNIQQDSLEIWINSRKSFPDTLHLFVNYRKTDSLGRLVPDLEHIKLPMLNDKRTFSKTVRKNIKRADTTCVFTVTGKPETVEQNGYELEFKYPIISANIDSIQFTYITSRQKEMQGGFTMTQDSLNLRKYIIRPKEKLQTGYEYRLRLPHHTFRDINGYYSDSSLVKLSLPTDEELSTLELDMSDVDRKIIVDLLDEKRVNILRSYTIDSDGSLFFPYLKKGQYSIRITEDSNRNGIVDTGSVLDHRQPEKVLFLEFSGDTFIRIPASVELTQFVNVSSLFVK